MFSFKAMRSIFFICLLLPLAMPLSAAVTLEGEMVQGGLVTGRAEPGAQVKVDGDPVRVSDQGVFLIAFGRDHPARSRVRIVHPDGAVESRVLKVKKREYRIQRIEGLARRKVTPKQQDLERIRKESAQVKAARKRDDPRTDFLSGWSWPVSGPISGVYGSQRVLNGKPRRPHFGVDIAAPVGTPVTAPADGVVTLAHPGMFFSGVTLIVDHGHNLSSSFLHLSEILVEVGDRVRKGEVIARVGKSGRVTGAHLDWRMNYHKARIDPQLLVPPMDWKQVQE